MSADYMREAMRWLARERAASADRHDAMNDPIRYGKRWNLSTDELIPPHPRKDWPHRHDRTCAENRARYNAARAAIVADIGNVTDAAIVRLITDRHPDDTITEKTLGNWRRQGDID